MARFSEIKGNFGFGCMRLKPAEGEKTTDRVLFTALVDRFMEAGFNYFDTARVYLDGDSEKVLKDCLTSRYPRESYVLADKLSDTLYDSEEDIRPLFEKQLETCGVEYFDFYLIHCVVADNYDKVKRCRSFETALELKKEGKIRHLGFSFHDSPEMLEQVLTEHPEAEFVQLQVNYLDYDTVPVQGRANLEVCAKHGKPVIVMEPVKGGKLAEPIPEARAVLDALQGGSPASYALRFAANCPGVFMTLSGMFSMEQLEENIAVMKHSEPLSEKERAAVEGVCEAIRARGLYQCTGCRYCTKGCPMEINIPTLLFIANNRRAFDDMTAIRKYKRETAEKGLASSCIQCGQCESACPQHLPIREYLESIAAEFEAEEFRDTPTEL